MKTLHTLILAAAIVSAGVLASRAQSFGSITIGPIASTVAGCPLSATNSATLCPVGSGTSFAMYVSYNGGAPQSLGTVGGVASFNGRSGAVTLTDADVTGAGVKVSTTVTSTATSTVQ
jgi:hypothetical protein